MMLVYQVPKGLKLYLKSTDTFYFKGKRMPFNFDAILNPGDIITLSAGEVKIRRQEL